MNTTNTNTLQTYPQVQAIEPTEKMQWQQEKQLALRVYSGLIMVIGGGMAAYSDINHISDTMTIVGAVMFFVGAIAMSINIHSSQYLTNNQRNFQKQEDKEFWEGRISGIGPYGHLKH